MVAIDPPGPQDPTLPAPRLISPANGTIFSTFPRRTECRWDPVSSAVAYVLEWDYSYNGVWPVNGSGLRGNASEWRTFRYLR
jgi:hypothetical protein